MENVIEEFQYNMKHMNGIIEYYLDEYLPNTYEALVRKFEYMNEDYHIHCDYWTMKDIINHSFSSFNNTFLPDFSYEIMSSSRNVNNLSIDNINSYCNNMLYNLTNKMKTMLDKEINVGLERLEENFYDANSRYEENNVEFFQRYKLSVEDEFNDLIPYIYNNIKRKLKEYIDEFKTQYKKVNNKTSERHEHLQYLFQQTASKKMELDNLEIPVFLKDSLDTLYDSLDFLKDSEVLNDEDLAHLDKLYQIFYDNYETFMSTLDKPLEELPQDGVEEKNTKFKSLFSYEEEKQLNDNQELEQSNYVSMFR